MGQVLAIGQEGMLQGGGSRSVLDERMTRLSLCPPTANTSGQGMRTGEYVFANDG